MGFLKKFALWLTMGCVFLLFCVNVQAKEPENEFPFDVKKFELVPETYYYKYTEVIGVKLSGWKYGLAGSYTDRFTVNHPITSWGDIITKNSLLNLFKVDVRGSYGQEDYVGTGQVSNIPDYNFEGRVSVGFDIPFNSHFRVTPLIGWGYRYLYNQFSDAPATMIDGVEFSSGYDRESKYYYLPIGGEAELKMDRGWSVLVKTEYDWFLGGVQKSHFEDQKDLAGDSIGIDTLTNKQEKGMGWRMSSRLQKETPRFDLFTEGFFRYWHIKESSVDFQKSDGALICDFDTLLCLMGSEPENKTWEVGLSLGAKF